MRKCSCKVHRVAGNDTVSITLTVILYHLAAHPSSLAHRLPLRTEKRPLFLILLRLLMKAFVFIRCSAILFLESYQMAVRRFADDGGLEALYWVLVVAFQRGTRRCLERMRMSGDQKGGWWIESTPPECGMMFVRSELDRGRALASM
jgi:hypothetical protein